MCFTKLNSENKEMYISGDFNYNLMKYDFMRMSSKAFYPRSSNTLELLTVSYSYR